MHIQYLNLIRLRTDEPDYSNFGTKYMVEPSDNLYEIASRFDTDVATIKELNKMSGELIHPGDIIVVDNIYNPNNKDIYKKYTIKKNDTLYSIAYNYGMTFDEIKEINNLIDDNILEGDTIFVYNNIPLLGDELLYIVKEGDSLYSIAKEYHTTVDKIKELNYIEDENLSIGTKIIIEVKDLETDDETEIHIVLPGDNLYSISQKKGISVSELMKLNNLSTDQLSVGQQLLVPKENQNGRIS